MSAARWSSDAWKEIADFSGLVKEMERQPGKAKMYSIEEEKIITGEA